MAEALRLHAQGWGVRRIGKKLGVSYGTIHQANSERQKSHRPRDPTYGVKKGHFFTLSEKSSVL